jgi:hypothetical protein
MPPSRSTKKPNGALTDLSIIDGEPAEVAAIGVMEFRAAVEALAAAFPQVEAHVRNARMTQIAEALDPQSVGITPTEELYAAWEASADASLLARTAGVLNLLQRLSQSLFR